MKDRTLITHMTDLLTQQEAIETFLQETRDREVILIDEYYKYLLKDYHETKLQLNSIVAGFIQLCEESPEDESDECSEELLETCDARYAEMERLNSAFHTKWGNRYEEYEAEIAAVNEKYDKLLALARNPAAFHIIKGKKKKK